jgi:hypothetical protein
MKRLILTSFVIGLSGCGGCGAKTKVEPTKAEAQPKRAELPAEPAQARNALIEQVKKTPAPVVVIALDGETLFDASGRSRRIFLEVLAEAGKNDLMRTVMERVEQGAPLRNQADYIRAAGISDEKLLDLLKRRFNERLTSDAYIPDDQPRQGGEAFFRALYQAGCTLVYVGKDDLIRSGPGWIQVLRNNSYPVLAPRAYLMLPPRPGSGDEAFEKDRFETIAGLGEVVATFSVLKADQDKLAQAYPKAHAVVMQPLTKSDRPGWVDFKMPPPAPPVVDAEEANAATGGSTPGVSTPESATGTTGSAGATGAP